MIGLDTNILIRYLVQDDPVQSKKVNQAIEGWRKEGKILWINQLTICEIFWVLERCYKLSREDLATTLASLLETKQIQMEDEEIVWQALEDFKKNSKIGFSDCLIGRRNMHYDCVCTYTFDKDAAKNLNKTFKIL